MNSYSIKQREVSYSAHQEFFCHFDDKYIIYCSKLLNFEVVIVYF